jgi:hypothetical protein
MNTYKKTQNKNGTTVSLPVLNVLFQLSFFNISVRLIFSSKNKMYKKSNGANITDGGFAKAPKATGIK